MLKRVLPHLSEDPEFVSMFVSEARMAAALDHPNIAAVTDIGEENGEYFFAMEYVHGRNLLEVLKRGAEYPLSMACALTVIVGVAAGAASCARVARAGWAAVGGWCTAMCRHRT